MRRVLSRVYSAGFFGGVEFRPELERSSGSYVGVAEVHEDKLTFFTERSDVFKVAEESVAEPVDPASPFPADFPLLAPQRAALVAAGLSSVEALRSFDWTVRVAGVGEPTVQKIRDYLAANPLLADPPAQ